MKVPEDYVGVGREQVPNVYIRTSASVGMQTIDPIASWKPICCVGLFFSDKSSQTDEPARANLKNDDFRVSICQKIYRLLMENYENRRPSDLLSMAIDLDDAEGQPVFPI